MLVMSIKYFMFVYGELTNVTMFDLKNVYAHVIMNMN